MSSMVKPRIRVPAGANLARAMYEGASSTRRMGGKGGISTGPNTPLAHSLPLLQSRSRNAIRNNPHAQGARDAYVSNMVGTGVRPDWANPDIQALWDRWAAEADADGFESFYGLQTLGISAQFESGELLTRLRFRRPEDGMSVPLQLQLMEPDHLDPALNRVLEGGRLIKMGVEFDAIGRRTAYHLWRHHPSERLTARHNQRIVVPAHSVVHLFRRTRPGQMRGVPELTSVIVRLYEIDEMQDAMLARQKLAQLFGAFVKRKSPDLEDDRPEFGDQVMLPGELEPLDRFTPGAIHYLEDDEEVTFSSPPDIGSAYDGWLRGELHAVAKGAGVTYEQLTGDLKGVNYSSIRAGLLEFRRRCEALQAHLLVQQWCKPVAAKWLDTAVVSRAITLPDYWENRDKYLAINWIAPRWSWVDPLKEVMADLMEVRGGFAPRSEKAAERGYSLDELDRRIQESEQSAERHGGLVFDSNSRQTNKSGAVQMALDFITKTQEEEEDTP